MTMPYRPGDPAYYPVPPEPDDEAPDTDREPAPASEPDALGIYHDRPHVDMPGVRPARVVRIPADIAPPSPRSQGGHVLPPTEPGR